MFAKYVRDPIFGYIGLTDLEKKIVDTFPMQRLRRIKQLSIADLTYPGGSHSRFSHALGTMHVAGQMADRLRSSAQVSKKDWQLMRLAGALHDVGHGPFSHSYEEVLSNRRNLTHEDMGKEIIRKSELADELNAEGYDPEDLVELTFEKFKPEKRYLKQIITSQVDADKMDFLIRDSYFTGVEYGQIDIHRLIQAMDVIDGDITIDVKAIHALEAFIIARYEMFQAVYYHHSVRAAEIMLQNVMDYVREIFGLTNFEDVQNFLRLDDSYFIASLRKIDPRKFTGEERRSVEKAKELIEKLDRRELIKPAYTREVHTEDEYVAKLLTDESIRRQKEEEIAEKTGVNQDYIDVDVPTVASVPYYPGDINPMEVNLIETLATGAKESVPLSERSRLIDVLKGYVDIIRVYTLPKYRRKTGKISEDVFKEMPLGSRVSM